MSSLHDYTSYDTPTTPTPAPRRRPASMLRVLLVLVFLGSLLVACGRDEPGFDPEHTPVVGGSEPERQTSVAGVLNATLTAGPEEEDEVTIGDLTYDTDSYLEETVVVYGQITEVIDDQVFRLNEAPPLGDEIILVARPDVAETIAAGDNLRVEGFVRTAEAFAENSPAEFELEDLEPVIAFDSEAILIGQRISEGTNPN